MRTYVKDMDLFSFARNLSNKYGKKILDAATRLDAVKTTPKKVVHKTIQAAGEFIENKIAGKMSYMNSRNIEEIVILLEKRQELLNNLRRQIL